MPRRFRLTLVLFPTELAKPEPSGLERDRHMERRMTLALYSFLVGLNVALWAVVYFTRRAA